MKLPEFSARRDQPFFLFAGPCVIESEDHALETAMRLGEITASLDIDFVYKSSFYKANRTSSATPRGPGRQQGLEILARVRDELGIAVITDVHTVEDIREAAQVVDVIQIPAFLCRQTDMIEAAAASGKVVNIKKGQFLSPPEMQHVVTKAKTIDPLATILVCERGSSFGYNNLVVDMRGLDIMKQTGCPVVFDATHSVQLPGAADGKSGGQREFIPVLARAAVAVGVHGLFMETHPNPEKAFSDGPNAWPLDEMKSLLQSLQAIYQVVKSS